jgi:hypothetical protein
MRRGGDVRSHARLTARLVRVITAFRCADSARRVLAFLGAAVAVLVGLVGAGQASAATTTYTYDTAVYAYDAPARLSSPDTVATEARGSPAVPRAVSWVSPVFVRGDGVAAEAGAAADVALPEALTLGRNAEEGVDVYKGVRSGKDVYVGITNNIERRGAEHGGRFVLEQLTQASVTRGEARAIEQAMIVRNPGFENAINSISPNHAWYQQAVDWGETWLGKAGL